MGKRRCTPRSAWSAGLTVALAVGLLAPGGAGGRPVARAGRRVPPGVRTSRARDLTPTTATLTGVVDPNRLPTRYWFEYGAALRSRTRAVRLPGRPSAVGVAVVISQLTAVSRIEFRLVAQSSAGTRYGRPEAVRTPGYYTNPVLAVVQGADPYVLDNDGTHDDYYAFVTGDGFPIFHSTDLVHWTPLGLAMSARPSWVVQAGDWHPWSPSVVHLAEPCPGTTSASCYVMFYTGLSRQTSANCVAVATATVPAGPYIDQGPLSNGTVDATGRPIGCGDNAGYGMIDPSPFIDPATGQAYLYGSEDFACPLGSTTCTRANSRLKPTISVIRLAPGLLYAEGSRVPLFSGTAHSWEAAGVSAPTVEGPTALVHGGTYYLLYSGGSWETAYGMGYATAPGPVGPFTKAPLNPIVSATRSVLTPGGGDTPVVGPHGGVWLVYHGRSTSLQTTRTLRIDPFAWRAGTAGAASIPLIGGPTATPQPNQP